MRNYRVVLKNQKRDKGTGMIIETQDLDTATRLIRMLDVDLKIHKVLGISDEKSVEIKNIRGILVEIHVDCDWEIFSNLRLTDRERRIKELETI
ncbi:MAG: hypothetical protein ACXQTX_03825 [Candidatus Syntropharchaeia archaeon]